MEANLLAVWNSHDWNDRQPEIEAGHVGVVRFDRLSDETIAHWLGEVCPSEYLLSDDADRKTRFSALAIKALLPIDLASPSLRVPHRPLRVAQRKVATKVAIAV
jgi:hypothetical protein